MVALGVVFSVWPHGAFVGFGGSIGRRHLHGLLNTEVLILLLMRVCGF